MASSSAHYPPVLLSSALTPTQRLNLLWENTPLAMIEWDTNGVIIGWNPAAAALFDFAAAEALGHPLDTLLAQRQISGLDLQDWLSRSRQGVLCEHAIATGPKTCRWYHTPLFLHGQRGSTASTIVEVAPPADRLDEKLRSQNQQLKRTLLKLKRAQVKLIQSEKMSALGQLVAGIAHEINNPVNFIHGNLNHIQSYMQDILQVIRLYQAHYPRPLPAIQAVTEDLELDYIVSDLPKLLNSVRTGTERIRQIVLSLRNFSRLDEADLKQTNITEGLESTLLILNNRLSATASRHAIEVIKAYENIPAVECYASQLNQVFMSILVNAIEAIDTAANPEKIYQIVLQVFQRKQQIVIQITNNGPPISTSLTQQIFNPFFTTKPVGKGTGMGLAISYQTIVDLHQGTLEYSQTADHKTVFTIKIPLTLPLSSPKRP